MVYLIYTPVVTPHNEDHSINETAFAAVIEDLIASKLVTLEQVRAAGMQA